MIDYGDYVHDDDDYDDEVDDYDNDDLSSSMNLIPSRDFTNRFFQFIQ